MATRFYNPQITNSVLTPAVDANWEQSGSLFRYKLMPKQFFTEVPTFNTTQLNSPSTAITTTQDYVQYQSICFKPLPAQTISGTVSLVTKTVENSIAVNASLAIVLKVISPDGLTVRGTLYSNFNADTEFPLTTSATRIVNAQSITPLAIQSGDLLMMEIGFHVAAPTSAGSAGVEGGYNSTLSDYALTSGTTTSGNPWLELSQDLWGKQDFNNYQSVDVGDGMSASEKIR